LSFEESDVSVREVTVFEVTAFDGTAFDAAEFTVKVLRPRSTHGPGY
jgi:hypothetical protein